MKRSTMAIVGLGVALIASNAWWAYNAIDSGITASYRDQASDDYRQALSELLTVVPEALKPAATPASILAAAHAAAKDKLQFEKDGFVWVGHLGYRFDNSGRLEEIQAAWSPL